MEVLRLYVAMIIIAFVFALMAPSINGQVAEPAPAPSSDGESHFPFAFCTMFILLINS